MRIAPLIAIALLITTATTQSAPQTGHFDTTFTDRSPLTSPEEMAPRVLRDQRKMPRPGVPLPGIYPPNWLTRDWDYDLAKEGFSVYVPENYTLKNRYGILVWTGVTEFSPEWFPVLARHRLIFIDPHKGDRTYVPTGLWIDAAHNLKHLYNIDDTRIYTVGFSNGGRNASSALIAYPDVFTGCFCICGDNFYEDYLNAITVEPFAYDWHGPLDEIKKNVRIVMMRGEHDTFTPAEGRRQFEGLLLDGFQRVSFFVNPGAGHQHPNAAWFEKGINALDRPPTVKSPTTAPTTDPHPNPFQIAQAKRLLHTARYWHETAWPTRPGPKETRRYLQKTLDDYPTTPSAENARKLLHGLESTTKPAKQ